MSIVVVIIALIVGVILIAQNLINAAALCAQISQINKYQTAVHTFQTKYGYLPGDMPSSAVSQFGFTAAPTRSGVAGCGDGNGELDGYDAGNHVPTSWLESGENLYFWEDLSTNSGLIEGNFNLYTSGDATCTSTAQCNQYFPEAKIGRGNSVYVYSGYYTNDFFLKTNTGPNFFGVSIIGSIKSSNVSGGAIPPMPGLTNFEAYSIDKKIDDGLPTTGNIRTQYLYTFGQVEYSATSNTYTTSRCGTAWRAYTPQDPDNINCGLSFQFQ